jgi:L-ascorbate metabolism protein UlaG (beta-lactamase superfamily)
MNAVSSERAPTMSQHLYLRPDIQVEPLVDRWYAWSQLIPPATLARNITERHLPIMESYVLSPSVHSDAVANPAMLGGPFIDYGGGRVDEIAALRTRTESRCARLIELSTALADLDGLLAAEAKGQSLEALYPRVPPILRGYVELVYDLNKQPSFRLLEPLLYRSSMYDESLQALCLSVTTGDDRPFVLSTPRLDSPDTYMMSVPFKAGVVDELFRLKTEPQPADAIKRLLCLNGHSALDWTTLVTEEPPPPYEPYRGETARWRYFGHACILIETKQTTILCDPVLSYTYESSVSRYTYRDLPEVIDFALITHNHIDHVLYETLLQLRHRIRHVVVPRSGVGLQDLSLRMLLEQIGFENVIELEELEELQFSEGAIIALPFLGEHGDLNVRTKSAYLVRIGRHSLLLAADSSNIEPRLYEHVHDLIGDVTALFLGMECNGAPVSWLYGPLMTRRLEWNFDQSRRLSGSNYEQAEHLVSLFGCKEVYVYAMGQEPWLNYVMSIKYTEQSRPIVESNRLLDVCRTRGIKAERLFGEREMFLD